MTRPRGKGFMSSRHPSTLRGKLEQAYQRIATLTAPKCGDACGRPGYCCKPEFCEAAIRFAREVYEVQLPRTQHQSLPLMGPNGCTVAPYLRPACSIYVCDTHFEDQTFRQHYQWLRDDVDDLEEKLNGTTPDDPWPPGRASEVLNRNVRGSLKP